MTELKETYHGAEIVYDERDNKWIVYVDGARISRRDSLANARSEVDGFDKVQKAFGRHTALYVEGFDPASTIPCTITSYMTDTKEAWISFVSTRGHTLACAAKSTRAKVGFNRLYEDTPENLKKLNQIRALAEQEEQLRETSHSIGKSLTPYKIRK